MWGDRVQPPGWPLTWTKPRSRLALLVLLAAHLRVANGQLARDSTELQQLVSLAGRPNPTSLFQPAASATALTVSQYCIMGGQWRLRQVLAAQQHEDVPT